MLISVCHKSISAEQVFIILIHCILPNHGGSGGRWEHHHHQCGWQRDHPIEARVVQRPRWQQVCLDVFWTLAKPTWCRRPYVCWLFTPSFCTIDRISSFSSRFGAWNACTCACGSSLSSGLDSHDACVFLPSTGASEGWDDTPRAAGLRMRSQVSLWSRIHYPRAGGATDLPPWGTGSFETSRGRIAAQSARPYGGRLFNSRTGGRGVFSWTAEKCWVHTSGFLRRWIYLFGFCDRRGSPFHSCAAVGWHFNKFWKLDTRPRICGMPDSHPQISWMAASHLLSCERLDSDPKNSDTQGSHFSNLLRLGLKLRNWQRLGLHPSNS